MASGGKVGLFLRAVNVGGRKLTMADFKATLAAEGFADAVTLAAAGNAVITAADAQEALETALEAALTRDRGLTIEVFARDHGQLSQTVAANPFGAFARADPGHLMAVLLRRDPSGDDVAALQATIASRFGGREQVAAGPRCLYATYPDGAGRSKLTAAVIERALGDRSTARNWNTIQRMRELTAPP